MTEEQIRQLSRWKQCFHCANLVDGDNGKSVCSKLQVSITCSSVLEKHGCILYREITKED
jgi:hypothetical protein